ncbi:MAG TPA: SDR family oxidoreductase [Chloroflexia bacterium]|jgi:NAD(P)-dependent dehydrogenase (short-subunit alcohol dehydrogenase family)|nr:SDR family oxidoreductase [Chloroflexia bacterium]
MKLEQRVAVITGAGSGIGQAMARLFAREGAHILAADVNESAAQETARMITEAGGTCRTFAVDVSRPEQVRAMIDAAMAAFGRIDILCNNAGIGSTTDVVECEPEEWDRVLTVNVKSVYLGCKYAIPHMLEQGGGVIVNTASVAGMVGLPKRASYSASKGAVIALTRQVAVEYVEQGIRVNCLCPGTVDSPWVGRLLQQAGDPVAARQALVARQPLGRLGTPDEIAAAALYLVSDDAAFITGTGLVIDGGLTAR